MGTDLEVKMEETNQSVKTLEAKVIYNEKTLVGTIEDVVAGVVEDCVSEKIKEILPEKIKAAVPGNGRGPSVHSAPGKLKR